MIFGKQAKSLSHAGNTDTKPPSENTKKEGALSEHPTALSSFGARQKQHLLITVPAASL